MSEHIQPAPSSHPASVAPPERTPGVAHEKSEFNLRLILWVGFGLIVTAAVIQLMVWWLLVHEEIRNVPPPEGESPLALEDARRPLGQRLLDVPPPHLEGIERESSLLIVRAGDEERRFYAAHDVHVRIKDKLARLFELREGQTVTITYHMPGGVAGGLGVATSVINPPVKSEEQGAPELPDDTRLLTGTVLKIEPRSVKAAREWAEVQMDRYGWADHKKDVARIPVATAMEQVLQSKEFRPDKKKGSGAISPPTRSSSGRGTEGGKP